MRFLCLHGMGTNPQILEAQIGLLRAQLPGSHDFVYLPGEVECDAAPGVSAIYPGPYLCYYDLPTTNAVGDAHDLVLAFIEDEGPFDAIIGFSQGAALASSLMLRRAKDASCAPLFQLAIFICASLPFDLDAPPVVVKKSSGGCLQFLDGTASSGGWEISQPSVGAQSIIQEFHAQGYNGLLEDGMHVLRRYHPKMPPGANLNMGVPTVNIVGKKDGYYQQGLSLAKLGGSRGTVVLDHGGGHEVPRDLLSVRKMTKVVQDAIEKVRFQC
ncbi:MAG: hypothetical protein L6R37_004885 [Teloschistes peruensis]|nr:MAG: hypothetical protein L6R37_004885 [Teloschistes peruensis]